MRAFSAFFFAVVGIGGIIHSLYLAYVDGLYSTRSMAALGVGLGFMAASYWIEDALE